MDRGTEIAEEQKNLAEYVKNTHVNLRKEAGIYGAEEAWHRHIAKSEVLQSYAQSMKKLATGHWAPANGTRKGVRCRIEWIANQCKNYFFEGGREHSNQREAIIKSRLNGQNNSLKITESNNAGIESEKCANVVAQVKMLDVGSCYNPFRHLDTFQVTAIDLAPSDDTVFQCDFLRVPVASESQVSADKTSLIRLAASSFDAVVFSLFLEYLPCPFQRFRSCEKARDLLKPEGILVIATPDSKHAGANAKFMKSWRLVLSRLGFMRIKYEKLPHMHCLVYRKCKDYEVAKRWLDMQKIELGEELLATRDRIYIPQDCQDSGVRECNVAKEVEERRDEDVVDLFGSLPYDGSDG